ncbi:hypothetical protein MTR67_034406 [Solanum verrucosum]|uniref:Tf2-1-like SH3-like domain-containing protein n=1 Tax=Solanum verrucosum TaxID=315347 RepID=A0AAF0U8C5_SOLVR|nr:hypothetical protein MTR67_034406 [Solanum verrucosum]
MVDPQKVKAVKNWVRPCSVTEVRSFVRLNSYYLRFVKNFASVATHLTRLTKKEVPLKWIDKCEERFQKLKTFLTTEPIPALPVKAYASRQLKVHERNYPTQDLELAVIVFTISRSGGITFMVSSVRHTKPEDAKDGVLASIELRSTFIEKIKAKKFKDESLNELRKKTVSSKTQDVVLDEGVAYRLALPPSLSGVHPLFHVSMLKKYHGDGDYIIKWDSVLLDKDL